MSPTEISRTASVRLSNAGAHAAFVPIGIVTVLLGPLLPMLSARWSLNYLQAGSLFTAQFLGSTLGVVVSGVLVSRLGFRFAINAGLLAMAVGVGTLPFGSRSLGLISIFCYGGGFGLAIPAINLYVAAANPERRSAVLSRLNFSWSVGAVACPFLVAASAKLNAVPLGLGLLAGFLLLVLLWIAATPSCFAEPAALSPAPLTSPKDQPSNPSLGAWSRRSLAVLSALFFLYVGTETAFGGWIASDASSLGTLSPALSAMTPSFFYAALMVGRWIAPLVLSRVDEIKTARAGLSLACLGMAGLVLARTVPLLVISVSVAGLGLAAVYPITISRLSREFGPAASEAGSIAFAMSNLGGASLPWIVGYSSQLFNNLRAGLAVPLATTLLMYSLYRWNSGSSRAPTA